MASFAIAEGLFSIAFMAVAASCWAGHCRSLLVRTLASCVALLVQAVQRGLPFNCYWGLMAKQCDCNTGCKLLG